jgi:hypothetical protein
MAEAFFALATQAILCRDDFVLNLYQSVKRSIIALGAASLLLLSTGAAEARLGAKVDELKNEPFMKQFAIKALIKTAVSQARVYELTPLGSSAENKVKLKLQFDAQERLLNAELWISKAYQKDDPTGAKQFAAWFLLTQTPLTDTASLKPLATEAEYRTEDPNYHVLGEQPKLPAKPTQGYQAIMGRASYTQSAKKSSLTITQVKENGGWTKMRLEPK